jgi:uncharacterized protein with beta-barrel porin domain
MSKEKSRSYRRLGLLASCSLAALLSGGGMPAAWAASCTNPVTMVPFDNPSGHTVANICVQNTSFTGSITNEGTVSPSGIAFKNGTINGSITSSGTIIGGISLDSASKVTSTKTAISVTGPTFSGGISNAGTISAANTGIFVNSVTSFLGGISNSGMISAAFTGILVSGVTSFSGRISNSGMISALNGIVVGSSVGSPLASFSGGISNSGTISVGGTGILVRNVTNFSGGISNSGTISAGAGFVVSDVSNFAGGISNSGTISAQEPDIFVDLVSTFSGGISNSGTISAEVAGILVQSVSTFSGGVSNSGAISGGESGIKLNGVSTFSGGLSNSGTISAGFAGIGVQNVSSLSGGISNSGTILTGELGISVAGVSTFTGGIGNSGTISAAAAGIFVSSVAKFGNNSLGGGISNSGTILAGIQGIAVSDVTQFGSNSLGGGISNSGTISAGATGIAVLGVSTFSGGINNSGTIVAGGTGITVRSLSTFSGGIGNSGTISAQTGIVVQAVSTFSGGISNSGTISAGIIGIFVGATNFNFGDSTFSGGIQNSGMISAGFAGISVNNVSTFSGGISNSGTISAGNDGILVNGVSTFSGGISNSGTISARFAGIAVENVGSLSGGISNSGTIAGQTGITVSSVSAFSGNISNSGTISAANGIVIGSGVTFAPSSAIVNSGTIIGTTAAIDVSAATSPVTIDQTGGLISGSIKLSTNADMLNVSGGTINGSITSLGTASALNQSGGLVLLSGTNSIGTATLTGGTLEIGDASHTSTTLTLTNTTTLDVTGGTLEGHGTLIGNATIGNGATLMPGGSIGTLTITGNLALSSGSTYVVEFSPTQASQTQVLGSATLGGATVDAIVTANQFGQHAGNTYTILTATNALGAGNVFNPVVSFGGLTASEHLVLEGAAALSYTTDAFLTVPNYAVTLALPSNAPLNAQNAANAFNSFILAGGTVPAGFQNLAGLSGNALNTAVNQLAGQGQGSFAPTGFQAGSMFLNLMLNPYVEGRGAFGTGGPAVGPALAYAPDQSSAPAAEAFSALALGPRGAFEPRMSFWASAYGGSGTIQGNATSGAATTTAQIYGFATGVDYLALPNTIFGLALGGGGTNWGAAQGLGGGHSDMFQAGIYGTSHIGSAYVSGALAYSLQDVTTTRTVTLDGSDTLQGNFAADVASARLEAGYRLPFGLLAMTPYGAVQTQAMFLPSYAEYATSGSSQFALTYTNHTYSATRTELGAWFDSDVLADKGVKLYGRLAWAHDFDNEGTSTAFFQSLPGANFLINSAKPAADGALVTAGFEYKLMGGWSVLGKFDGEFSSTTAIFSGTGTIRNVW